MEVYMIGQILKERKKKGKGNRFHMSGGSGAYCIFLAPLCLTSAAAFVSLHFLTRTSPYGVPVWALSRPVSMMWLRWYVITEGDLSMYEELLGGRGVKGQITRRAPSRPGPSAPSRKMMNELERKHHIDVECPLHFFSPLLFLDLPVDL
jgi:hypothetical protein